MEEYNQSEFLRQLNSEVLDLLNSEVPLSQIIDKIDKNEISFNAYRDFVAVNDKDFAWLPSFKHCVNAIRTIISNPKIHLRTDKILLNVDTASKVDTLGMRMTVKEPQHWRKKQTGEFSPEYVYANVYEDELPIYENRFVCLLINKMYFFISLKIAGLYLKTGALNKYVDKDEIELSNIDSIKLSAGFYQQENELLFNDSLPLLTTTFNKVRQYIEQLIEIKISLNKIRKSHYYQTCMKAKVMLDTEVKPTNVLTMHPDYRVCYEFYRKLIKYVEKEHKSFVSNKDYQNYVVISVVHCLLSQNYSMEQKPENVTVDGNKIVLKELTFTNEPINYILSTEDNKLKITVRLIYKQNKFSKKLNLRQKREANYLIDIMPNLKYMFFDEKRLNTYIDGQVEEYTTKGYENYYIISPFDTVHHQNTVMVSPHTRKLDKNVKNLLSSFVMFIEGDEFIYSRKCPICSSFLIDNDEVNYQCLNCNTLYAIMNLGEKEKNNRRDMIWIKRINANHKR